MHVYEQLNKNRETLIHEIERKIEAISQGRRKPGLPEEAGVHHPGLFFSVRSALGRPCGWIALS